MATTNEKIAALRVEALAAERKRDLKLSSILRRKIKNLQRIEFFGLEWYNGPVKIDLAAWSEYVTALNSQGKPVAVQQRLEP